MKTNKKQKEVVLDENTLTTIKENAKAFEPSEEYKTMMDKMIDNHHNGNTNYTSWETIKKDMRA